MTTTEPPSDTPEQPEATSSVDPVGPSGNSRKRWFLIGGIGGAAAVVAIVVVVVVMMLLGGRGGVSASALELIPEDVEGIFILDVQAVKDNPSAFPGDADDFEDYFDEEIQKDFETEEIDFRQVSDAVFFWLGRRILGKRRTAKR